MGTLHEEHGNHGGGGSNNHGHGGGDGDGRVGVEAVDTVAVGIRGGGRRTGGGRLQGADVTLGQHKRTGVPGTAVTAVLVADEAGDHLDVAGGLGRAGKLERQRGLLTH